MEFRNKVAEREVAVVSEEVLLKALRLILKGVK